MSEIAILSRLVCYDHYKVRVEVISTTAADLHGRNGSFLNKQSLQRNCYDDDDYYLLSALVSAQIKKIR